MKTLILAAAAALLFATSAAVSAAEPGDGIAFSLDPHLKPITMQIGEDEKVGCGVHIAIGQRIFYYPDAVSLRQVGHDQFLFATWNVADWETTKSRCELRSIF